jgi:hypothetical protein
LAAVAVGRDDEAASDVVGDRGPEIAAHDMQAEIEAGSGSGRGQDVAVVDEQQVRLHVDGRKARRELVGAQPVRGGRAVVENTGFGERERAGMLTIRAPRRLARRIAASPSACGAPVKPGTMSVSALSRASRPAGVTSA